MDRGSWIRLWPLEPIIALLPCHNCHSQIHELAEMAPKHWATVHLWTIICLAAGVLCRNERTYLHDDLKEVNIPEWDETEFM